MNSAKISSLLPSLSDISRAQLESSRSFDFEHAAICEIYAYKYIKEIVGDSPGAWRYWSEISHEAKEVAFSCLKHHSRSTSDVCTQDRLKDKNIFIVFPNCSNLAHERQMRSICGCGATIRDAIVLFPFNSASQIDDSYVSLWKEACGMASVIVGDIPMTANSGGVHTCNYFRAARWISHIVKSFANDQESIVLFPSVLQISVWLSFFVKLFCYDKVSTAYVCMKLGLSNHYSVFDYLFRPMLRSTEKCPSIISEGLLYQGIAPVCVPQSGTSLAVKPKNINDRDVLVIGSVDRSSKKKSPEYLQTISSILRSSNSQFLWTDGENEISSQLRDLFGDRIIFTGWVDPLEAMRIIDIYVEPYPWGGGDMTYLSMAHGMPLVSVSMATSMFSTGNLNVYGVVSSALRHSPLPRHTKDQVTNSFCETHPDMIKRCLSLIDSLKARQEAGMAMYQFYQNHVFPIASEYLNEKHN